MKVKQLTVKAIMHMLQQGELRDEVAEMLQKDSRVTVVRMMDKWQQERANMITEKQRIQKLYAYEQEFYDDGYELLVGIDEAGRGSLAGPVVVGVVVLSQYCYLPLLNDSKQLTSARRDKLYSAIQEQALAVRHEVIDAAIVDKENIYQATVGGMYAGLEKLPFRPEAVLIDAVPLPHLTMPSRAIIGGDTLSASIAAASIIAKVERDRIMEEYDKLYPQYGFTHHKGYGTKEHMVALKKWGPCPIHRRTFEPIKSMTAGESFLLPFTDTALFREG